MNLSLNWLSEFVPGAKEIDAKSYCDRMTDTGSKVEGYDVLANDIENVKVARVTSMTRHENSDHLWVCQCDIGDRTVQIVTGAQNVFEGAIVPACVAPAKLPGGVSIKAGKLRGVESNGMLCSINELGLTEHDMPGANDKGILILGEEFADKVGCDIKDALMLRDTVVEFEITSNRPDCLSVIGLARESAVSFDLPLQLHTPVVKGSGDSVKNYLTVTDEAPDLCFRYTARVVKNVKIAPSPLWLRMRLRAEGVRPINNIVDITNYVMLEYGQPMHAFDYACLDGSEIIVRRAGENELFRSLDDKDHTLDPSMLVIADSKKAVALAGVMGGANSEITESTKTVVFESASFLGSSVRVSAKKLGMRTESSSRFEKGLDPENTLPALERACELVELIGAGEVVDGIIDLYPTKKASVTLPLDADRINRFIGVDLTKEYMAEILRKLEFKVSDDLSELTPPSFRSDIECIQDVAEEIIRIYGYNRLESTYIGGTMTRGGRTPRQALEAKLAPTMASLGFDEIQTFSFISPKYYEKIRLPEAQRRSVVISNPLGEDTSVMRTTALPSMLEVLARNDNFSNEKARLWELASVYIPHENRDELPDEKKLITVGMYDNCSFYTLKGVCEKLFELFGILGVTYTARTDDPSHHPGRCAEAIAPDGTCLGVLGQVHPAVTNNYGFTREVFCAELDLPAMFAHINHTPEYSPLPKFPAITRDFSFVCDDELEVGKIEEVMSRAGGKLVESVRLFDVYRGQQLGEGKKSVSMRVTLRAADRTLTVEEADKASQKILNALNAQLGIGLRG